jgi:uncharacterized damage-inducible protein DinB
MTSAQRLPGFHGEFLWELEIVVRQIVGVAEAMPADKYDWRPNADARSVSEVLIHVSVGNFMLLDSIGITAPADVYGQLPAGGRERFRALTDKNDEMETGTKEKDAVVTLLKRSLDAVTQSFTKAGDGDIERRLQFFGEETTVRRVYLRLLAHTNEHMGQMIAYLRSNGIAPPWPDWRPNRRPQS